MSALKPLQDLKSCADFVKRANALWSSGCNGANAFVELGKQINAFIESEAYLVECPTVEVFFKKHLPWCNQRQLYRLRAAAKHRDGMELLEAMGEPIQIEDSKPHKKRASRAKVAVVTDSPQTTTPTTKENLLPERVATTEDVEYDETGTEIPKPLLDLWRRRGEIEELMAVVKKVKCHINSFKEDGDVLFRKVSQQATEQLALAYTLMKDAVPCHLCGICEGRLEVLKDKFCKACSSTGFMSEREYKLLVPEEKRKIRKLANAERNGK